MDHITRILLSLVTPSHEMTSFDAGTDLKRLIGLCSRQCERMANATGSRFSEEAEQAQDLERAVSLLQGAVTERLSGSIDRALWNEEAADRLISDLEEAAQGADDDLERMREACHGDSE